MNLSAVIMAGALSGAVFAGGFDFSNIPTFAPTPQSWPPLAMNFPATNISPATVLVLPGSGTRLPGSVTNWTFFIPRSALNRSRAAESLKPGVYTTTPFSCLVLVPSEHVDDGCLITAGNPDPKMPVVRPELRLIPRNK